MHLYLYKKILKRKRKIVCYEVQSGAERSKWCCEKSVPAFILTPNVDARQRSEPGRLTTKANGEQDGWLRILVETHDMVAKRSGHEGHTGSDGRQLGRRLVEGGGDEWWRDWALGGADVTQKEVPTHGAASVAEQQLRRRFHVPGLGGQRWYYCVLRGGERTEHMPWTTQHFKIFLLKIIFFLNWKLMVIFKSFPSISYTGSVILIIIQSDHHSPMYTFWFWPYQSPWHRVYLSCVCSLHWELERRRRRGTTVLQSVWTFLGLVYTEDAERRQSGINVTEEQVKQDRQNPAIYFLSTLCPHSRSRCAGAFLWWCITQVLLHPGQVDKFYRSPTHRKRPQKSSLSIELFNNLTWQFLSLCHKTLQVCKNYLNGQQEASDIILFPSVIYVFILLTIAWLF